MTHSAKKYTCHITRGQKEAKIGKRNQKVFSLYYSSVCIRSISAIFTSPQQISGTPSDHTITYSNMDVSKYILIYRYIYIKIDNNDRRKYYYFRVQMRRRSGGYGSHWSIISCSDSGGAATIDLLPVITLEDAIGSLHPFFGSLGADAGGPGSH
jgi:hypothetical protein